MKKILHCVVIVSIVTCLCPHLLFAGTQGHYLPGVMNIRDFVLPSAGVYALAYDPYYSSDEFYGPNSKKLESAEGSKTVDLRGFKVRLTGAVDFEKTDIRCAGSSPTFIWVPDKKILGTNFAFILAPYIGYINTKLKAKAKLIGVNDIILPDGSAVSAVDLNQTDSGFGDLLVRPLWLGWHMERFDIAAGYGFYAPTGHYDHTRLANMGLGFWSHELSLGAIYYVTKNKATALMFNVNYEFNTEQNDTDVTPGQYITLEYGVSQYLSERLEIGVSGYSVYQTTKDKGSSVFQASSYVNGVGGQVAYWVAKNKFNVSARYTYEYTARGRFKGSVAALNCAFIF